MPTEHVLSLQTPDTGQGHWELLYSAAFFSHPSDTPLLYNQRICLHKPWNTLCSTCTVHTQTWPEACFYASSPFSSFLNAWIQRLWIRLRVLPKMPSLITVPEHLLWVFYLALVPAGNRLTALMSSWRSSSFQPFPPLLPPPPPLAWSPLRAACLAWTSASLSLCSWVFTSCTWREEQQHDCVLVRTSTEGWFVQGLLPLYLLLHGCLTVVFRSWGQDFIQGLQAGNRQVL